MWIVVGLVFKPENHPALKKVKGKTLRFAFFYVAQDYENDAASQQPYWKAPKLFGIHSLTRAAFPALVALSYPVQTWLFI